MNTLTRTEEHQTRPRTQKAFHSTELLVGGYLPISVLTLVGVVLLRNHATVVNSAVWTHGTIVAASALLLFTFTVRAAGGSRRRICGCGSPHPSWSLPSRSSSRSPAPSRCG
jgi:hypothetical protein